jgi:hypothetical protein
MKEEVYVDPPKLFAPGNRTDRVIILLKSLYGLKKAPNTFYEKLSACLKNGDSPNPNTTPASFSKPD